MNFKVGIIGYGMMGKHSHQAIDETKLAEVIAISEPAMGQDTTHSHLTYEEILNHSELTQ